MNKYKKWIIIFSIILSIFLLDFISKRYVFTKVNFIINKTVGVHTHIQLTSFLNIVKVVNTGVSFGLFNSLPFRQIILSIITLIILIYISYLLYKEDNIRYIVIYSLIIAGGIGNLFDRIFYGGVYDFIDFHIGKYHWPAFNIADSVICIAICLVVYFDLFEKYIKKEK